MFRFSGNNYSGRDVHVFCLCVYGRVSLLMWLKMLQCLILPLNLVCVLIGLD